MDKERFMNNEAMHMYAGGVDIGVMGKDDDNYAALSPNPKEPNLAKKTTLKISFMSSNKKNIMGL